MRTCQHCSYYIEENWRGGVCGSKRSPAYELIVTPDTSCSVHTKRGETCYSPLPRFTSAAFSGSSPRVC
jgi:hypothetical protein